LLNHLKRVCHPFCWGTIHQKALDVNINWKDTMSPGLFITIGHKWKATQIFISLPALIHSVTPKLYCWGLAPEIGFFHIVWFRCFVFKWSLFCIGNFLLMEIYQIHLESCISAFDSKCIIKAINHQMSSVAVSYWTKEHNMVGWFWRKEDGLL